MDIYGKVRKFAGERSLIPFRYQGQYEDTETGLYYNRFRYYSPDTGTYISQDPIGLAGGMPNFYAYVHDSNSWIDPLGLVGFFTSSTFNAPSGNVHTVYQQSIDWDYIDPKAKGLSNLELASQGNTPFGTDGRRINLHHSKQNAKGSLFELSGSTHSKYTHTNALHPYRVNPDPVTGSKLHPDNPVDRAIFDKDRSVYWEKRAEAEKAKRQKMKTCH